MCLAKKQDGFKPGITAFDDYATWHKFVKFGKGSTNVVVQTPDYAIPFDNQDVAQLSDDEKDLIKDSIAKNVTSLADQYPNVEFYYFFSPYSAVWWGERLNKGELYGHVEAEQLIIELLLEHKNIKLFSCNCRTDITTNRNNYMDSRHFGSWINSLFLKWMHEGTYQLTKDNYRDYIAKEIELYTHYDYSQLANQQDYAVDLYPAALFNEELTGKTPKVILQGETSDSEIRINDITGYDYLVFYAKNDGDNQSVRVMDGTGQVVFNQVSADMFEEWNLIVFELSMVQTKDLIIRNGSCERSGADKSGGCLRDVTLY